MGITTNGKEMGKNYMFGFSRWKRNYVRDFFDEETKLLFCRNLADALRRGLSPECKICIWGKKAYPEVENYAARHSVPLYRVEDGFLRSVSLGSDLTRPFSLVIDSRGIYFDPTQESDLEHILSEYDFDEGLLKRAKSVREYLRANRLSKYNCYQECEIDLRGKRANQEVVLVPGQVEDDASILYGGEGMSNLELLRRTRQEKPEAYIVFKPHPDVLAGNRQGAVSKQEALEFCDQIVEEASLDSVLDRCDSVHTITSLVGFEALLRGKEVTTYGMPFYAGWGLTTDRRFCERRRRSLTLDALAAAVYILYPRYIDPCTGKACEIEETLEGIEVLRTRYNNDRIYRTFVDLRNGVMRKIQLGIKVVAGE